MKQLSPPVGFALVCHRLPRVESGVAINTDVSMMPNLQWNSPTLFDYGKNYALRLPAAVNRKVTSFIKFLLYSKRVNIPRTMKFPEWFIALHTRISKEILRGDPVRFSPHTRTLRLNIREGRSENSTCSCNKTVNI
jgi:hypothetical protein